MTNKYFDLYRPNFEAPLRLITDGSKKIYLYSGKGLVPDSKTIEKNVITLDYAPIGNIELPKGSSDFSPDIFCQGCRKYSWKNQSFSIIVDPQGKPIRVTEQFSTEIIVKPIYWILLTLILLAIGLIVIRSVKTKF